MLRALLSSVECLFLLFGLLTLPAGFKNCSRKKGASQVALVVKTLLPVQEMKEAGVRSLGREDPLE